MVYGLNKTIIVGLGGTGMHSVLYTKKRLLETYGHIPPMIKFIVMDTTDQEKLELGQEKITLEAGEFLKLEVKDPYSLIKTNKQVKSWLPEEGVPIFALDKGAKQIRPLGRLAVFANASEIEQKINGLVDSIRDYSIDRNEEGKSHGNIYINLVGSLSGGTGSGTFFDIACLINSMLNITDKLIGYFLLPDAFLGKPATGNVEPNAYAALKEINWFFTGGRVDYVLGASQRVVDKLFDAVYLLNNTNTENVQYNAMEDLWEFIGTGMYLQSTTAGQQAANILDNVSANMLKPWFTVPTAFSSFGLSELVFPSSWFASLYSNGIANNIVQSTFKGENNQLDIKEVNDFITETQLNEHDGDPVINSILSPGIIKKFALPPVINKEVINSTFGRRDQYLNDIEIDLIELSKRNLEKIKSESLVVLRKKTGEIITNRYNIETAKIFVNEMIGKFNQYKTELGEEKVVFQGKKKELENHYNRLKSESNIASKALFNVKSKLTMILKEFKQYVEKEAIFILEIERRDRAIEFYSILNSELLSISNRLNIFSSYCDDLIQDFSQENEKLKNEKKKIKPFVKELIPEGLTEEIPIVNPQEFIDWLVSINISGLELINKRKEDLKNLLLLFGKNHSKVKDIESKSLEEILKTIPNSKRKVLVNELDKMAAPLWQYDRGYISGDKRTEKLYIFGVESPTQSVFQAIQLMTDLGSTIEPQIIGTGDKKRIVCLKIETALPAFVLKNMNKYKTKYEDPNARIYFHLHKDWEKIIPDLFPETEEEGSRKYWSLALASPFNLISKTGEYYYVHSEKYGDGIGTHRKFKLTQGRKESMKQFINNHDLIMEVKELIEQKIKSLGNEAIEKELTIYGLDLEKKAANATKETISQIDNELKDIESFIQSMKSLR